MSFVAVAIGGSALLGVAGASMGAGAAKDAANAQAASADKAAQVSRDNSNDALNFNRLTYNQQQENLLPYLQGGQGAYANLLSLMGLPVNGNMASFNPLSTADIQGQAVAQGLQNGQLVRDASGAGYQVRDNKLALLTSAEWRRLQPSSKYWDAAPVLTAEQMTAMQGGAPASSITGAQGNTPLSSLVNPALGAPGSLQFKAPDSITEQNDPGFQARLKTGMDVLQRSAAAKGNLLTGGTAKAMTDYGQTFGSNEYQNVYNRSLTEHNTKYNELASMAGIGQTAGNSMNASAGTAAGQAGNILMTAAGQQGQDINNAGAARASGYVGSANAWGGALNGIGNNLAGFGMLNYMNNGGNNGYNNALMQGYSNGSVIPYNTVPMQPSAYYS